MKKLKISYIERDGEIYLHGGNLINELIEYNLIFADDAALTPDTPIQLIDWILQEIEGGSATV
jgi:hypothetical protein